MIKIRKFNEEFYDGMLYDDTYHEIFINPTKEELDIVYAETLTNTNYYFGNIRFLAKNNTKKLYVFNGEMLHDIAIRKIFNADSKILTDSFFEMFGGSIKKENNNYIVDDSDSLESDIHIISDDPIDYIKFLLEIDWSWIDNYIIFSPWWEIKMIPNLKKQLEEIEKELE